MWAADSWKYKPVVRTEKAALLGAADKCLVGRRRGRKSPWFVNCREA